MSLPLAQYSPRGIAAFVPSMTIVLTIDGLYGSWTTPDSQQEYMDWTRWLRMRAKRQKLTLSFCLVRLQPQDYGSIGE